MGESLIDAWGVYLRANLAVSEHTLRAYISDLRSFTTYCQVGELSQENIRRVVTLRAIRSWLASLVQQGKSRSTISRRTASIRSFTAWAYRRGYLDSDPGLLVTSARGAKNFHRFRPLLIRLNSCLLRPLVRARRILRRRYAIGPSLRRSTRLVFA